MSEPLHNILFEINTMLSIPDNELNDEQRAELDKYLDELADAEAEKIDGCVAWMKEQVALAEFYKAESNAFKAKAAARLNAVQRLKDNYLHLFQANGLTKVAGSKYSISIQNSPVVAVDAESSIPSEWWREKVERSVDKEGIKKALKSGVTIPGVHLEDNPSIRMR